LEGTFIKAENGILYLPGSISEFVDSPPGMSVLYRRNGDTIDFINQLFPPVAASSIGVVSAWFQGRYNHRDLQAVTTC
jgi:hypothetical protein